MRRDVSTRRVSTLGVLLAALVLMSLACSFAVTQSGSSAEPVSSTSVSAELDHSAESSSAHKDEEGKGSHPCGVPQSQPSVASSPLIGPMAVLPLLDLFLAPPQHVASVPPTHEDLPLGYGDGLLTLLCVQQV